MFPFATTRSAETEYSLLSPSAKRRKMHLLKSSSEKSDHNSSIEDISVTEQDNMSAVCISTNIRTNIIYIWINNYMYIFIILYRDLNQRHKDKKLQNLLVV